MNIVESDPLVGTIDDLKNQLGPEAIQVEQLEKPTKVSLTHKVQGSEPFHVVHFVGRGKYENDRGYLALMSADDEKKAAWMKDTDLADMFRKCAPRLIFLHACEGARSESYTAFRGLALQLAYSNIPAVVAMQYEVPNKAANQFANTFYKSLGEGKPIDVAVQAGRLSLGTLTADDNYISREFGSPVVYLQSAEGIIIAESKQPAEESQPAPVRKVLCPYGKCTNYVVQGDKCCDSGHKPLAACITSGCPGVVIPGKFCRLCEQRQPGGDRPNVGIQAQTAAAGVSQAAPQDFGVKQNPGTNVADLGAATSPSTLGTTGSPGAGLNGGTR
jgi:CHAT domain